MVYFEEYLPAVGVETLVIESQYVDRDFLEDYAAYYVRCFYDYARYCSRVHFFAEGFDEDEFSGFLCGENGRLKERLKDSYRGFLVVKPLPQTIFGRSCLATYSDDNGRRHYPTARTCEAHLFSLNLKVQSLPFQEQDTSVARCATSALWSIFQATAALFGHSVPTPIEITRAATAGTDQRALPNQGLNIHEVAAAIRACGLEPLTFDARDPDELRRTAYGYLRAGLPTYLSVELVDLAGEDNNSMARHAVAVTGFSLSEDLTPVGCSDFGCVAHRIDKLYVHDDGVGPFARMELEREDTSWTANDDIEVTRRCWKTSRRSDCGGEELYKAAAAPLTMVVPVYHKIRVPYHVVYDITFSFAEQLNRGIPDTANYEWDIFLTTIQSLKSDLSVNAQLTGSYRRDILESPMPRFIWRARASNREHDVLELLFDATDIEQGQVFFRAVEYNRVLCQALREVGDAFLAKMPDDELSVCIFRWFEAQNTGSP